jgi:hypothetical protein
MSIKEKIAEKRNYNRPHIDLILLDNEISLALESTSPDGPGEGASLSPQFLMNDQYKNELA